MSLSNLRELTISHDFINPNIGNLSCNNLTVRGSSNIFGGPTGSTGGTGATGGTGSTGGTGATGPAGSLPVNLNYISTNLSTTQTFTGGGANPITLLADTFIGLGLSNGGGITYNAGTYTISTKGMYTFTCNVYCDIGFRGFMWININGTQFNILSLSNAADVAFNSFCSISGILLFNVNDQITFTMQKNDAGNAVSLANGTLTQICMITPVA